jgi:hypothetical protein
MKPPVLLTCLHTLSGRYDAAKEGLLKLGDIQGLLQLNVQEARWEDAFLLLAGHSAHKAAVYLPYAKWLRAQDRCALLGGYCRHCLGLLNSCMMHASCHRLGWLWWFTITRCCRTCPAGLRRHARPTQRVACLS